MFSFGGEKKTSAKDTAKAAKKDLRRGRREVDREKRKIERDEKRVQMEIKKAAKKGDMTTAKMLAKELVRIRATKTRLTGMSGQMGAMAVRTTTVAATATMSSAMGSAAAVMARTNAAMDPHKMAGTMQQFARQTEIMNMSEEMMDDALADAFEDDSEEEDAVVSQVLDEIGIDLAGRMADAPTARVGTRTAAAAPAPASADPSDAEVAAMMRELGV